MSESTIHQANSSNGAPAAQGTQKAPNGIMRRLIIGIKRKVHRQKDGDAKIQQAEAALKSQRKGALEKSNYRCIYCGFRSLKYNEVHHLDDDHHNSTPENMACICKLCHPYHHVGEAARRGKPTGIEESHLGVQKAIGLIRVPNDHAIPAQDLNHLQRAIAIAMSDPKEAEMAGKVYGLLSTPELFQDLATALYGPENVAGGTDENGKPKKGITGVNPVDMAAALSYLTEDEYKERAPVLAPLRVLYHPNRLIEWGRGWKAEQPAFADPEGWERLLEKPMQLIEPVVAAAPVMQERVGAEVLMDDDDVDHDDDDNDDDEDGGDDN